MGLGNAVCSLSDVWGVAPAKSNLVHYWS